MGILFIFIIFLSTITLLDHRKYFWVPYVIFPTLTIITLWIANPHFKVVSFRDGYLGPLFTLIFLVGLVVVIHIIYEVIKAIISKK